MAEPGPARHPRATAPPWWRQYRAWRLLGLVVVVAIAGGVVVRPDPVTWAMRLAAVRDPTTSALSAPPRLGEPVNLLVVGSDARVGTDGLEGRFGGFSGARADVLLVVRVKQAGMTVLQVPRDLRVESAQLGTEAIATVLDTGGSGSLVRETRRTLGVPVHHYVEVGFSGFAAVVDQVGGVAWSVRHPLRDARSGLRLAAGEQTLDGATLLAYLRARSLEERRDGTWHPLADEDLGRMQRQQQVLCALLARALDGRPSVADLLDVGRDHVRTDASFTAWTAGRLAERSSSLRAEDVEWFVLPVTGTDRSRLVSPFGPRHVGGRYWLELDAAAAEPVLAELRPAGPTAEDG